MTINSASPKIDQPGKASGSDTTAKEAVMSETQGGTATPASPRTARPAPKPSPKKAAAKAAPKPPAKKAAPAAKKATADGVARAASTVAKEGTQRDAFTGEVLPVTQFPTVRQSDSSYVRGTVARKNLEAYRAAKKAEREAAKAAAAAKKAAPAKKATPKPPPKKA